MPQVRLLPHPDLCPEGREIHVKTGASLCESLLKAGVAIEHACEMVTACSTCHVYVRQGGDTLNEAGDDENDQLDNAWGLEAQSRLRQTGRDRHHGGVSSAYQESCSGALSSLLSLILVSGAGRVSPRRATHFLLLRQEKVSKEKASRIRRPFAALRVSCVARSGRGLAKLASLKQRQP